MRNVRKLQDLHQLGEGIMTITIEHLQLPELIVYLHKQEEETFPERKDKERLNMLSEKWHKHAEFCTCRDEEGQLVGMLGFYANQPETGIAFIIRVYVNPQLRGIGIFEEMLHLVQNYIKQREYSHLRLEVRKDNQIAQKAYLKQGFHYERDCNDQTFFMKKSL